MNDLFTAALSNAARGWAVVPLHTIKGDRCSCGKTNCKPGKHPIARLVPNGLKNATTDPATITDWWTRQPDANIAIVTGAISGLVVLDVDPGHGGDDALADLEMIHGKLPQTVEVVTGSGGRHIYFRHPGHTVPNSAGKVGPGLDVRGDGGYVVAPTSLHLSGQCYQWEISSDPADTEVAEIPEWLLQLMTDAPAAKNGHASTAATAAPSGLPVAKAALDFVANGAPIGQQRERALKAARSYLGAGHSVNDTVAAIWRGLQACPCGDSAHPWILRDAENIVQDLASRPAPPPAPLQKPQVQHQGNSSVTALDSPLRRTDTGNAESFAHLYGSMMRYDHSRSRWLRWCTHWWIEDSDAEVRRLAEKASRTLCHDASTVNDPEIAKKLFGWALKSLQRGGLDATISLAQAQRPIADKGDSWDLDSWLLGVNNGVVDLRTGTLRAGRQEDRITKHADVDFDPDAECPLWLAFLDRIMGDNQNLISFLQRAVGYSLTGAVSERVLFILHGQGANGKSTLLDTVRALLGSYALRTPTETLMMKQQAGIPNDIARLKGARFVFASEAEGGKRLAESLIKDMTGNEFISARFMRSEFFDFKPEFKIWLGTNHKPEIRGTDNGIWDRLKLIPFAVRIPETERDRHLGEKLCAELPGILQWAIAGCLDWQENGLGVPDEVRRATNDYRGEQDALAGFIGEHCIIKPGVKAGATALYKAYVSWCEDSNEKPEKQKAVAARFRERGFTSERSGPGGNKEWHGIGLVDHNLSTEPTEPTEPFLGLELHENNTAGVNGRNDTYGSVGSVKVSEGASEEQSAIELPASSEENQPGIQIATARKAMSKSDLQELMDQGFSKADAIDIAALRQAAASASKPELDYYEVDDDFNE